MCARCLILFCLCFSRLFANVNVRISICRSTWYHEHDFNRIANQFGVFCLSVSAISDLLCCFSVLFFIVCCCVADKNIWHFWRKKENKVKKMCKSDFFVKYQLYLIMDAIKLLLRFFWNVSSHSEVWIRVTYKY